MTTNTKTAANPVDSPIDSTTRETVTVEENRTLRHIMTQFWKAWDNGQKPPTSIPSPNIDPFFPPGYGPFDNCGAEPSTTRPQGMPFRNNPTGTTTAPVYTLPQPIVTQREAQERQFITHPEQYYTLGIAFGGPYSSMQDLGGHKSVTFKDLCVFPNVHLPPGFKTPKFDKYDGHGDPIAHLKRYCNQLWGAEGKEELLTDVASEWFIDQDITHRHIWDDMTQYFVRQFQYNVDIMPARNTLSNTRKKPSESFREYAINWRNKQPKSSPR
ncbi:uncharacterized protein [Solanum lycopersicum]|uniref:uncharacterized protein n=1 Tax=Solanum lycopersicum TaxID=4081 RepID=UPI003748F521